MSALLSLLPTLIAVAIGWVLRHYGIGAQDVVKTNLAFQPSADHVQLLQLLTGKAEAEVKTILAAAAQAAIRQVVLDAQKAAQPSVPPAAPKA